jgi:HEAT repeat protein
LLRTLERDDLLVRYAILEALVKIGSPVPLASITSLAGDPLLKKAVFECLGVIGDLGSVPLLIDGLTARARNVREAALVSLDLIRQRSSGGSFQSACGQRLREFAGTDAVEYLIAMRESTDLKVKSAAILVLGMIGDVRALEVLVSGYRDENVRQVSIAALHDMAASAGPYLLERFATADDEERCIITHLSGEICLPESKRLIAGALHDLSPFVRALAAEAAGKVEAAEFIPQLVGLLNDDNTEVRHRATSALVRLASVAGESVARSASGLADSDNPDCRLQAVRLFGALQELSQLTFLSKDEDHLVRKDAIMMLGTLKRPEAAGRLSMALADEEADVRLAAATALGWQGFADEAGSLVLALDDPSQRVQAAAMKSLGSRRDRLAFDRIAQFLPSASGMLKIVAMQSLVQIDPAKAGVLLAPLSKDADEEVARVAANLLDAVTERS